MSRGWFVCRVPFWFCVLHGLVVSCWLGVFCAKIQFSCARNVHLLELTVLPRLAAVLPLWEAQYYRATTWYYRSGAVLWKYRTGRDYRVRARYYRAVEGAWGVMTREGEFQLPIPIHLSLSPHLSRSRTALEALADLRLRPLSSDSGRWDHSPPLPLAMDQGFPQIPLFLGYSLASRFLGRNLLFLRF